MEPPVNFPTTLTWTLPDWLPGVVAAHGAVDASDEARMALVIAVGAAQLEHGTGGPFAAAVFSDGSSPRLLAVGVNLVVPAASSTAHAEIVALSLAGQHYGTYDLTRTVRSRS